MGLRRSGERHLLAADFVWARKARIRRFAVGPVVASVELLSISRVRGGDMFI